MQNCRVAEILQMQDILAHCKACVQDIALILIVWLLGYHILQNPFMTPKNVDFQELTLLDLIILYFLCCCGQYASMLGTSAFRPETLKV